MKQLLIIGYGNPLRSDDGIGWIVADQIAARLPHARVVVTHQLTPEIAESISQSDFVLFVDAYAMGEPGTLRCELILPDTGTPIISHHIAPSTLLTVARRLYHHCPRQCFVQSRDCRSILTIPFHPWCIICFRRWWMKRAVSLNPILHSVSRRRSWSHA